MSPANSEPDKKVAKSDQKAKKTGPDTDATASIRVAKTTGKNFENKRKKIIYIVVVACTAWLFLDELFNPEQEATPEDSIEQVVEKTANQEPPQGPEQEFDKESQQVSPQPPHLQQEVAREDVAQQEESSSPPPNQVPTPPPLVEDQGSSTKMAPISESDETTATPEYSQLGEQGEPSDPEPPETNIETEGDGEDTTASTENTAFEEDPPEDQLNNMSRILDSIQVNPQQNYPPPNYLEKGRGLVYNCVQKHWACVNRASYFQCAHNQKASSEKGINPFCVIRNVYFSPLHCSRGQLVKIHQRLQIAECYGN